MKLQSLPQWLLFVGVLPMMVFLSFINSTNTQAQVAPTIRIPAGQTVEIATDAISQHTEYNWILTKDRKFQSAQRNRFFQNRFAETGIYSLDVSTHDAETGQNAYRSFSIIVTEALPEKLPDDTSVAPSATRSAVIVSEPAAINGVVYLPPSGGILKLDASFSVGKISTYSYDLNTSSDTNGDGDPQNDTDNEGMLSEKIGSALYLFVVPSSQPRSIRLTVSDLSDETAASTQLNVSFSESPQGGSTSSVLINQDPTSPVTYRVDGMSIQTDAQFDPSTIAGKSLLLEWDFGDRSKSLLNNPTHTYSFPGTYTLSLIARDITTGDVIYEGGTTVQILPSQNPTSSVSSSQQSVESSSSSASSGSGGIGSIITVVVIIFFLLLIAGGLYAVLTWIKKRTTYSIQKTLEKVEETIVRKDAKEEVLASSSPMSMKKSEDKIIDAEKSKTDFKSKERTQITPTSSAGPVPSWLQQTPKPPTSSAKPSPVTPPPFTPAAKPIITERKPLTDPQDKPKEETAKAPSPKPAPAGDQGQVPDWLKPTKPSVPPVPKMAPPPVAPTPVTTAPQSTQKAAEPARPVVVQKEAPKLAEAIAPSEQKEPEKKTEAVSSPVAEKEVEKVPEAATPKVAQTVARTEQKEPEKKTEAVSSPVVEKTEPVNEKAPEPTLPKVVEKEAPKLAEALAPSEQKEPEKVTASPVPKDIPLATPQPLVPKDAPKVKNDTEDDDPPIAIIQADSLMK